MHVIDEVREGRRIVGLLVIRRLLLASWQLGLQRGIGVVRLPPHQLEVLGNV